jgi:hypothetical protein
VKSFVGAAVLWRTVMMYCRQVVFEVISGTEAPVSEKSHVRDFVGKAELGKLPVRYIDTAPYRYREKN